MDKAGWPKKAQTFGAIAAFVFLSHCTKSSSEVTVGPQVIAVPDQSFDSNGVRIRYVSVGQGEPIILIHGWAADAEMWDSAMNSASKWSR